MAGVRAGAPRFDARQLQAGFRIPGHGFEAPADEVGGFGGFSESTEDLGGRQQSVEPVLHHQGHAVQERQRGGDVVAFEFHLGQAEEVGRLQMPARISRS